MDLYRLSPHADLGEIGVDYYMTRDGVTLIEWPERLDDETVGITHRLTLSILEDDSRNIFVETSTSQPSNP